jgi:DNA-binding transcriptional LysR family regulator
MELRQLHHFTALIGAGSFTGAAEALGLSQPALSQSIRRLERELGRDLLVRARPGAPRGSFRLTEAGQILADECAGILTAVERAERRVRSAPGSPHERTLKVGFSPGVPQDLVTAAMRLGGPGLSVTTTQLTWGEEFGALLRGHVDVAILQYPGWFHAAAFHAVTVREVPLVALLPHSQSPENTPVTLAELAGIPTLDPGLTDAPTAFRELWLALPRPRTSPAGTIVGPPNRTIDEMFAFVAAGRGMAITSLTTAVQHPHQEVTARLIKDARPVSIGLVRLSEDHRPHLAGFIARITAVTAGRE